MLLLVSLGVVLGGVPKRMNYQGKLTDPAGVALNDTVSIEFRLYDVPVGGSPLWSETHPSVAVVKGLFDVVLGETNPLDLPFDTLYYLELVVEGETLSPRHPLLPSPYSIRAEVADHAAITDTISFIDSVNYVDSVRYIDSLSYVTIVRTVEFITYIDSVRYVDTVRYIDSLSYVDLVRVVEFIDYVDSIRHIDTVDYIDSIGYVLHTGYADSAGRVLNELVPGAGIVGLPFDGSAPRTWSVYLSSLGDVDTSGLSAGDVLKWDGSAWVVAPDDTGAGGGGGYWVLSGANLCAADTTWSVGIGTSAPSAKLTVKGDAVITGAAQIDSTLNMTQHQIINMIIENRTSDPPSPKPGQIWYRTDL